jgi:hypothetical protein
MLPASGECNGSSIYILQKPRPIEDYVSADLYLWLEAHSRLTDPFASLAHGNIIFLSTDTDSNSSSRSPMIYA